MKRYLVVMLLTCSITLLFNASSVSALSLKVAPLEYKTKLDTGESKKGVIDISNPTGVVTDISVSVQAFRQTDDDGSLEFFDDEIVEEGIKLDLDSFRLESREALRMYFVVDGKKLPSGNVFAAIFFTTEPSKKTVGVGQSVRLGTLLSIENGTVSDQSVNITDFSVPFIQFGDRLEATYTLKNTGDPKKTTGFYPEVSTRIDPFHEEQSFQSPLVFAGRSRSKDISMEHNRIGVYKVSLVSGDTTESRWTILLYPKWTFIAVGVVIFSLVLALKLRRPKRRIAIPSRKKTALKRKR
jgi:hypothetical protein